jgi:hypothetical protein
MTGNRRRPAGLRPDLSGFFERGQVMRPEYEKNCSGEIIQETLTLPGASPPPLRNPPIAMTT